MFSKILSATRRFQSKTKQALTAMTNDPVLDEQIDVALERLTNSSTNSPESLVSTPTP